LNVIPSRDNQKFIRSWWCSIVKPELQCVITIFLVLPVLIPTVFTLNSLSHSLSFLKWKRWNFRSVSCWWWVGAGVCCPFFFVICDKQMKRGKS
jgi:hypothetical protein